MGSQLVDALRRPLEVSWRLEASGVPVVLRAVVELGSEFPPPMVMLEVHGPSRVTQVKVPGMSEPEQIDEIIQGVLSQDPEVPDELETARLLGPDDGWDPSAVVDKLEFLGQEVEALQLRSQPQWHPSTCSHHALFNASVLLRAARRPGSHSEAQQDLLSTRLLWSRTLGGIQALVQHGEASGKWVASRVTSGMADEAHLQVLIDGNPLLSGAVRVLSMPEQWSTEEEQAVAKVVTEGREVAFLLGAAIHWVCVVVTPGPKPRIWYVDSENRRLAEAVRQGPEAFAAADEEANRARRIVTLGAGRLQQAPDAEIQRVLEEGMPQYWRGVTQASEFWRFKPRCVRERLMQLQMVAIETHLTNIVKALRSATPSPAL